MKITPTADASDDPTVQFSILPDYDDELNPTYDDVVVTVQASTVDLTAPAARTKLVPASGDNNKARALEIRDNSTEYVFDDRTASPAKRQ